MKKYILLFTWLQIFLQLPGYISKAVAQDTLISINTQVLPLSIPEAAFNTAVKKHKEELDSLIDKKTGEAPDVFYRTSHSYNPSDTSVQNITRALLNSYGQTTAVLFYNYEGSTLKTWLLNYQGIMAWNNQEIEQAELEKQINELREALGIDKLQAKRAARKRGATLETTDTSKKIDLAVAIRNLTNILLPAPLAAQMAPVKALIIVPVLALGTVPFAILKPFKENTFLVEKMSISMAPSLFEIRPGRDEEWTPLFSKALIIGNPYFTAAANAGWYIPPLPGAEKEAVAISRLVNSSSVLIRKDATKTAVMARVSDADFLYFATHGVSDSRNSRTNSFLILSGADSETGFWTMEEILNNRYKARLAVLSACQTGLGETYKGGIMALGRTFQVAGVPRVVMSLWNVDDNATVYLMETFVTNLQKNPPAESLRQAMLKTRNKYADPSKWASFVLFGTPK